MEGAKKRRASAKAWLTRVSGSLDQIINKTDVTEVKIQHSINDFEMKLKNLHEAQFEVESYLSVEELESDITQESEFIDRRTIPLIKAKELLMSINRATARSIPASDQQVEDDLRSADAIGHGNRDQTTKLPKLEIPKYSGDYTKWQPFWDKFTAVIDQSNLPVVNKFTYLQSLLQGEAAAAIAGLSLTTENYTTAKAILEKRFGRKERIIFGHIQQLLKPILTNGSNLWRLHDEIQANVRSLENLGVDRSTYGVVLTPLVLHQLPTHIRLEWARVGEGQEGNLTFLLDFLHDEIRRRERSQTFEPMPGPSTSGGTRHPRGPESKKHDQKGGTGTTAAFLSSGSTSTKNNRATCVFCKGGHFSDQCPEIKDMNLDQRKEKIMRLGLCFICLGSHHLARNCQKHCYFCKGKHHAVLCQKRSSSNNTEPKRENSVLHSTVEHDNDTNHIGVSYANSKTLNTVMQVVKTKINGVGVNVMFDSGADRSFVTKTCADKLGLRNMGKKSLTYCCFAEEGTVRKEKLRDIFEMKVNKDTVKLIGMNVICCSMYRSRVPHDILDAFTGIPFEEDYGKGRPVKIDILIGLDNYWALMNNKCVKSTSGLVAQETAFGWMLSGAWYNDRSRSEQNHDQSMNNASKTRSLFCQTEMAVSETEIRRMWDLDSIGIGPEESEDDKMLDNFNKEIKWNGERYTVKLPWKDTSCKETMMNNKTQALSRLNSLSKKLNKNPDMKARYDAVLEDLQKNGIIGEIQNQNEETSNPTFYLPHRPVVREASTSTKVRPVFDASCKAENGISLNDCMNSGPNLIPNLAQTLLRFRRWRYGLTADIVKAFLQIELNKCDQDTQRFLWDVNGQIRTMRFERVIFGNTSSPFLLNATLKFHLSKFERTRTVKELTNNLYVDDWLTGADTEQELMNLKTEATQILNKGGFPLAKWTSNSDMIRESVNKSKSFNEHQEVPCTKILGISWITDEDSFSFETFQIERTVLFSKRRLLSLIARMFDPLGFASPFTITLKIMFQDIWKKGLGWDDILPAEYQGQMKKWIDGMTEMRSWKIPRRISLSEIPWNNIEEKELIVFADASEKAYGCCVYLKTTTDKCSTVSLVMSKVKIAPLKRITLPRLELLAALLGARLVRFISSALELDLESCSFSCWTDSEITLKWIQSDAHKWKQFVRNRVQEIQMLTNPADWKHCPGRENPADLLTRGLDAEDLMTSRLWKEGPVWLTNTKTDSAEEILDVFETNEEQGAENTSDGEQESRANDIMATVSTQIENPINFDRFSRLTRAVRVMAWILRFAKNARCTQRKESSPDLSSAEIETGRIMVLKSIQNEFYNEEISDLKNGKCVRKTSSIYQLSPFIGEDGLIRVYGRLEKAPALLYDEKHPILLPKCHITYLLVRDQHELMKHAGVNTLITAVRGKYWILSLRTIAKKICKVCIDCQRQDSRPCQQIVSPLPEDRIKKTPPFSICGVDHAGPLFCSDTGDRKLYILLFTCAVIRAVHVELVDSLSVEDFILALKRFASRRGMPSVIYSDNAKPFMQQITFSGRKVETL